MKFDTSVKEEKKAAYSYFVKLTNLKKTISITKFSPGRSLKQNSYLHLLIGAFGIEMGYTLEEAKVIYKRVNPSTYVYHKKGAKFMRSSADLSVDEMTLTIDKFRAWAKQNCKIDLPLPTDTEYLRHIENQMERSQFL